jgi:hypothetical protein
MQESKTATNKSSSWPKKTGGKKTDANAGTGDVIIPARNHPPPKCKWDIMPLVRDATSNS